MIQLQPIAPLIKKILREQIYQNETEYRWASFVLVVQYDNGHLLYNVMTKELLFLNEQEFNNIKCDNGILVKKWFLVPISFHEKIIADQVKQLLATINSRRGDICNYTIFTTTSCNAQCSYCFESKYYKLRMNKVIANETTQFMIRNSHAGNVNIQWFGGEPLLNMRAIDQICFGLKKADVSFISSMTTNGYLFSESVVEKCKNLWMLNSVQITLDGTEKKYNDIKSYVYKHGNPFKKVYNNIELLLSKQIDVTIRLNVSLENSNDIYELIKKLVSDYSGCNHLSIYVHPLFELINDRSQRNDIVEKLIFLHSLIDDYSLGKEYTSLYKPRIHNCKADANGRSVVIFPDGNIGLCDHQWQSDYIGNVISDTLDNSIIRKWQTHIPFSTQCASCLLYPDCLKLRNCDTNNHCFTEFLEFDKFRLKCAIINKYKTIKSKNETEVQNTNK